MAWIEIHESLPEHDKIHRLTVLLKQKNETVCIGMMVCLWLWALSNAEDGDLSGKPLASIARACRWNRSPAALMSALKEAGFVDEDGMLHDWMDYAGRLVIQRNAHRKKCRENAAAFREKRAKVSALPNLTEPNPTGLTDTCSSPPKSRRGGGARRLTARESAFRELQVEEMRHLAGDDAADEFAVLLSENDFTETQINTALDYTRRKQNRGEIQNPLGYVHQLLIAWDEQDARDEESIQRILSWDQ